MLLRQFVCTEGTSDKFWRGGIVESRKTDEWLCVCQWGRNGTSGQSLNKAFYSKYAAEDFLAKKIREKKGKGYREIKSKDTAAPAGASSTKKERVSATPEQFKAAVAAENAPDYGGLDLSAPVMISEEDMRSTVDGVELDLS